MSDADVDYGPDDPSDMILRDQRQTMSTAMSSLDDDPQKAARSFELGEATGDHPAVIYGNLDNYENQHKAALTAQLLNSSKYLRQYVDVDPMHAKLSNDDYGNLDNVSQKLIQSSLPGIVWGMNKAILPAMISGFKEGFGEGNIGSSILKTDVDFEQAKNSPFSAAIMAALVGYPEIAIRGGSGLIKGATEAVKAGAAEGYKQFTGDEQGAERFSREMAGMAETVLTNTSGYHGIHAPSPAQLEKVHGIINRAKPWLDDGKEPPRGLDPEIDKLKFEQNKIDVDNLDEALKASTQSATRERNPDIFAGFIRQHTDAKIGISGDAVAKLYGNKIPEAGDNILGWSPGLAEELEVAKATGGDVHVPLADWLAKVDPEVAKALHDDIRVRPGGITKVEKGGFAEAKEGIEGFKPAEPLPESLPSLRAASALEPLFSVGDRKLELKLIATEKGAMGAAFPREGIADTTFHDLEILDENKKLVGSINLSEQAGGKQLYIEMIQGGPPGSKLYNPNSMGPALMRDLLRQLKAEFPNAETITGHRVSGAREKAESYMKPSASPVIKLDDISNSKAIQDIADLFQHGDWQDFGGGVDAYVKWLHQPEERKLIDAVNEVIAKIVPKQIEVQPAAGIESRTATGTTLGTYIQYTDRNPLMLWSLAADDAVGVAKHEAIHHLRSQGFFTGAEWNSLTRSARDGDWIKQYEIDERYPNLDNAAKLEEAIADGYRYWSQDPNKVPAKLHSIFEKIKEFVDAIRAKFREILGKEPTWEELFGKVESGEIGSREGNTPIEPTAFRTKHSTEGDRPESPFGKGAIMPVAQQKLYDKLIAKRHEEDLSASISRAEAEQRKRQTKEWKDNEKEVRSQVQEGINSRPDIAADNFFVSGELFGDKLKTKPKLNAEDLTPEQIAQLPKEYVAKSGFNPDIVANLFGYSSGDAMVAKLGELNEAKLQSGLDAKAFTKRLIDMETERQMMAKYGSLEKSILEEAKDQAISETQLDLLHEEVLALGLKAGSEFPITKGDLKTWVKDQADRSPIGSLDTDKYLAAAGKSGKATEMALLKGDFAEAFREKQKQYLAMQMANESKKIEKQVAQFDKQAKRLASRDQPSMEATYVPFIHQILLQVGKPIKRSVQDLQSALGNVGKSLEDFVLEKEQHSLREVPVANFLYDENFSKKFEDLTAEEFRAVHDSIKALSKNARDELKIYKAGEEADLAEIKTKMVEQLRTFKEQHYDASGGRWLGPIPPKVAKVIRTYGAAHLQLESLFNRWDRGDPRGVFSQYVMRDLATSANYESALEKKYSRLLKEVDDGAKLGKGIDNPIFYNPLSKTGGDADYLMQMTRKNLRAILLNAGNESNLAKLAKGYSLKPEQVRSWLDQHATKGDWAWAQKIGDVFAEIKKEADTMYSGLTGGVEPEAIDIKPFTTPHGEQKGWYYPIIYHPEFEGASKRMMGGDVLEEANFHRATTPAGYTKSRTAYFAPMSLDLDMLPVRMRQMLHDIAMRPAVINASKIFYDKDVRAAIQKHYGSEYKELLIPYLKDVANSANFRDDASRTFANASEFIRQNMISTLIGLNPGTVMKHGPTAAINSMTEVGIGNFAKAVSGLMSINERSGESNWKFAMEASEELQRRHRHYNETLSGATQSLVPTSKFMSMRESLIKFSSTPVAISDLLSAVPTWLAKYETAMDEHGIHGDAIAEADRSVRRAHGSTAITNRSGVMRTGPMGAWMASVYGFFNHIMNRQYELMWKAGDTLGMVKQGDLVGAMKMTPELTVGLFSYVLLPALIEEMVTPLATDDKESWGKKAAKGIGYTLSASWIGVRDIASAMLRGQDPAVGLFSTTYKSFVDIARDMNKDKPLSRDHAGKIIQHGATVIGTATGLMNAQMGKAARYGYDVSTGKEHPKGPWSWMVGTRFGTTDKHSKTFDEWLKHH